MRSHRLLFIRAVAVLVAGLALCSIASLALPHVDWTAAAWLLPALGLSFAGLAVSSAAGSVWAFGGVASLWIALVVLAEFASPVSFAMFRAPEQWAFLGCAVVCAVLTVSRREIFDARRSA